MKQLCGILSDNTLGVSPTSLKQKRVNNNNNNNNNE
jgi:hypothetical protein